jgi:hypothetical protein
LFTADGRSAVVPDGYIKVFFFEKLDVIIHLPPI